MRRHSRSHPAHGWPGIPPAEYLTFLLLSLGAAFENPVEVPPVPLRWPAGSLFTGEHVLQAMLTLLVILFRRREVSAVFRNEFGSDAGARDTDDFERPRHQTESYRHHFTVANVTCWLGDQLIHLHRTSPTGIRG